jgi:hypothetical protein
MITLLLIITVPVRSALDAQFSSLKLDTAQALHLPADDAGAHHAGHRPPQQLEVAPGLAGHHPLVEVALERPALHVLVGAQLHQRLAAGVAAVEHLLQQVEEPEHEQELVVPPPQVTPLQPGLRDGARARPLLGHCLPAHPAGLGREVDALAGAPRDVARSVADQRDAPDDAARALRDRVRLHLDHAAVGDLGPRARGWRPGTA